MRLRLMCYFVNYYISYSVPIRAANKQSRCYVMWSEREKGPPMTERNKKVLTFKGKPGRERRRGMKAYCA